MKENIPNQFSEYKSEEYETPASNKAILAAPNYFMKDSGNNSSILDTEKINASDLVKDLSFRFEKTNKITINATIINNENNINSVIKKSISEIKNDSIIVEQIIDLTKRILPIYLSVLFTLSVFLFLIICIVHDEKEIPSIVSVFVYLQMLILFLAGTFGSMTFYFMRNFYYKDSFFILIGNIFTLILNFFFSLFHIRISYLSSQKLIVIKSSLFEDLSSCIIYNFFLNDLLIFGFSLTILIFHLIFIKFSKKLHGNESNTSKDEPNITNDVAARHMKAISKMELTEKKDCKPQKKE